MHSRGIEQLKARSARLTEDLGHAEARAQLSEFVEGTLPPDNDVRLERHLDRCGSCAAFARTLARTVDLVRALPRARLSPAAREQLRRPDSPASRGRPARD
jgi:anti-sigma factor RsiW